MCLIKTHRFPKISRKPIICYKRIEKFESDYFTYTQLHKFNLGDIIKAKDWLPCLQGTFYSELTSEVVHAYRKECIDEKLMKEVNNTSFTHRYIKCEIPPFTPYWIGRGGEIGATRIKTIEEV